ncbi:serine/threonine protein kinase [Aliivibrio logei]|uniref:Serine/threonine protein kinase n=1 Tax=Aliivibrio logei 5S-186 TaxID=626086 RepID=A0ABX3AQ82_ALILO|nr:serine/threonine-protein kinase [Aliivibrio logei]OEF09662.1 serine/threonine protein kinase [Aliivibrio logei 5S-186]
MDLDDIQQQKVLDDLKNSHPDIYRDVTPLLNITASDPFSDLFSFHAQQAFHVEWDFSRQLVDKYQITEELGRGGMGVVYSAYRDNGTFEQELAIKFIQPDFNNLLNKRALFEEAQLLARLNHPYIAKVFDGGEHQGVIYVVMEKVIGTTLNEFLYSTQLSPKEKLLLFSQICQALEHAHQNDVLHADLKPENILIDKQHCPKLIDFNLTQKVQNSRGRGIKELVAYSEHFASPEQKKGDYLTPLSDVYSLGKILHLLFPDLESKHDIACIQQKATQINLSKRYNSVEDLRHDIESVVSSQPITLKQQNPLYVLHCLLKRKPVPSFLLVLLILSGLLFSGLLIFKNHQLEQEKIVAQEMVDELIQLLIHSKKTSLSRSSIKARLDISHRRILSNPNVPTHIKHKILLEINNPLSSKKYSNCLESHETLLEPKFIKS